MGFTNRESRADREDRIPWNRIQAQLEDEDGAEGDEILFANTPDHSDNHKSHEDGFGDLKNPGNKYVEDGIHPPRATRINRKTNRQALTRSHFSDQHDSDFFEIRLQRIKASAERIRRMKRIAVEPDRKYKPGEILFDPNVQKFGQVVYSSEGYVRLEMRDGTQSALGKPPLKDRKNFVFANFERMSNKVMAEILGVSVHTMRRICHEYGLRRYAPKNKMNEKKTA